MGQVNSLLLLDVTPLSLGIETVGDVFARVIDRNTTIPVQRSQIFTTAANFQSAVEVHVLQGEREIASCNKSLGKFKLTGIKRAMRGVPQIEVTFSIDANGIVNVSAKDLATQKSQDITISGSSNMSQGEIERAVQEARAYAAKDAEKTNLAQIKNRAEGLIYQAEQALSGMGKPARAAVKEAQGRVRKALAGQDGGAITAACDELERALSDAGATPGDAQGGAQEDGSFGAQYEPEQKD